MPLEVARFLSSSFHRHNLNQQTKRVKYLELKAKLADRKLHVLKHTDHKLHIFIYCWLLVVGELVIVNYVLNTLILTNVIKSPIILQTNSIGDNSNSFILEDVR